MIDDEINKMTLTEACAKLHELHDLELTARKEWLDAREEKFLSDPNVQELVAQCQQWKQERVELDRKLSAVQNEIADRRYAIDKNPEVISIKSAYDKRFNARLQLLHRLQKLTKIE